MEKITIKVNLDEEMMFIHRQNGASLFYGNFWDVGKNPQFFKELFEDLDFSVEVIETKESI